MSSFHFLRLSGPTDPSWVATRPSARARGAAASGPGRPGLLHYRLGGLWIAGQALVLGGAGGQLFGALDFGKE